MKKRIVYKWCLIASLLLNALNMYPYDFKVDGFYYNKLSGTEVEITYGGGKYLSTPEYEGDLTIPSQISYQGNEYNVKSIGEYAFFACNNLYSIIIPNSIISIKQYAFHGCI